MSYKKKYLLKILGIETSCDETAAAVIDIDEEHRISILSNVISSQVKLHAPYGGVVPNLASREHAKNIGVVFEEALQKAGIKNPSKEIDLIAVTKGPGLGPALVIGIAFAKTIALKYRLPLIGVNHLEGHIYSNWLAPVENQNFKFLIFKEEIFTVLNLIVSGGHTELVLMRNHSEYKIIGETLDDAVGEAFDKVARLLGLGYPGGPVVSARAEKFLISNFKFLIKFPKPMAKSGDYNFSYSGLKTAVLYKIKDLKKEGIEITESVIDEICYAFQKAAIEILVEKTMAAARKLGIKSVFLSGGVSANKFLRQRLETAAQKEGLNYAQPPLEYTTDNAVMIAAAGYFNYLYSGQTKNSFQWPLIQMDANLRL